MLAERLRAGHGIPWLTLGALKMGLHLGAPSLNILPDADDMATAEQMWPIIEPILDHALFDGRAYLVEGVNLRPQQVALFMQRADAPVRACFLGYPDISIHDKTRHVAQHVGPPTDWLYRTGDTNMRRYLHISRDLSRELRDACATVGIPFVDTGKDFQAGLAAAEHALCFPPSGQ